LQKIRDAKLAEEKKLDEDLEKAEQVARITICLRSTKRQKKSLKRSKEIPSSRARRRKRR
jgi:hypothetical protein